MSVKIVEKPWGSETIWAHTDWYVGKILRVKAGEELSIQYHHEKDETMYVLSGEGFINFFMFDSDAGQDNLIASKNLLVKDGDSVHIAPTQIHNVEAITDMVILEASTNHLNDLVRIKDRYNRG